MGGSPIPAKKYGCQEQKVPFSGHKHFFLGEIILLSLLPSLKFHQTPPVPLQNPFLYVCNQPIADKMQSTLPDCAFLNAVGAFS